jgi:hypothetical protein
VGAGEKAKTWRTKIAARYDEQENTHINRINGYYLVQIKTVRWLRRRIPSAFFAPPLPPQRRVFADNVSRETLRLGLKAEARQTLALDVKVAVYPAFGHTGFPGAFQQEICVITDNAGRIVNRGFAFFGVLYSRQ